MIGKALCFMACFAGLAFAGGHDAKAQPKDRTAEIRSLTVLASRGDAEAQYKLGEIYRYQTNYPHDFSVAAKWYERAAEAGHPKAQFVLGVFYMGGMGVPQDYVLAHKWLNLSQANTPDVEPGESKHAKFMLNSVASAMTPAQIAEAQRLAREWRSQHPRQPAN